MGLFEKLREKKAPIFRGLFEKNPLSFVARDNAPYAESSQVRAPRVVSKASRVREGWLFQDILRRIKEGQTKSKERTALLQDIRTWKITLSLPEIQRLERDLDATKNTTFIRQLLDALKQQIGSPARSRNSYLSPAEIRRISRERRIQGQNRIEYTWKDIQRAEYFLKNWGTRRQIGWARNVISLQRNTSPNTVNPHDRNLDEWWDDSWARDRDREEALRRND